MGRWLEPLPRLTDCEEIPKNTSAKGITVSHPRLPEGLVSYPVALWLLAP